MREYEVVYDEDHGHVHDDIPFSSRVRILAEAVKRKPEIDTRFDADYFYEWNSYVLPLCVRLADGSDEVLDDDEVEMVLEAWVELTHLLDVDHHYAFADLDACLAASGSGH